MRPLKILIVSLLILSLLGSAQPAQAANNQSIVIQLDINGVINPFSSRYLERGLDLAQRSGAELVLVTLDTPGGLEASMREMVQAILGSPVPVVVYVTQRALVQPQPVCLSCKQVMLRICTGDSCRAATPMR